MTPWDLFGLIAGFSTAILVGSLIRILIGLRLNLYLVNRDTYVVEDQVFIPITAESKKYSLWKGLKNRRWMEEVEITLLDDQGYKFTFQISFHPWKRFLLSPILLGEKSELDAIQLEENPKKPYILRTGQHLRIGDRHYEVLVTPTPLHRELQREFAKPTRL